MNRKIIGWAVRIFLIALILWWMIIIFGFSSADGTESSSLSDKITIQVVHLLEPDYDKMSVDRQEILLERLVSLLEKQDILENMGFWQFCGAYYYYLLKKLEI